jgi:sterol desaturase/sphingolipid hydroxylase (fatty acid hydroxylase superfamily)
VDRIERTAGNIRTLAPAIGAAVLLTASLLGGSFALSHFGRGTALGIFVGLVSDALGRHFDLGFIDLAFAPAKGWPAVIGVTFLSMLIYDFFFYWYHRCMHKIPMLWPD